MSLNYDDLMIKRQKGELDSKGFVDLKQCIQKKLSDLRKTSNKTKEINNEIRNLDHFLTNTIEVELLAKQCEERIILRCGLKENQYSEGKKQYADLYKAIFSGQDKEKNAVFNNLLKTKKFTKSELDTIFYRIEQSIIQQKIKLYDKVTTEVTNKFIEKAAAGGKKTVSPKDIERAANELFLQEVNNKFKSTYKDVKQIFAKVPSHHREDSVKENKKRFDRTPKVPTRVTNAPVISTPVTSTPVPTTFSSVSTKNTSEQKPPITFLKAAVSKQAKMKAQETPKIGVERTTTSMKKK